MAKKYSSDWAMAFVLAVAALSFAIIMLGAFWSDGQSNKSDGQIRKAKIQACMSIEDSNVKKKCIEGQ